MNNNLIISKTQDCVGVFGSGTVRFSLRDRLNMEYSESSVTSFVISKKSGNTRSSVLAV